MNKLVASRMREIRRRHRLTQEQTAALVGCDYKYYQAIEAGTRDLKLTMLEKLSCPFGLTGAQLLWENLPPTDLSNSPPERNR